MDLLQERKDFGFPPYSRIIALTIKDMFEDRAQRMSFRLAAELRKAMPGITGPYPPTPDKIADQFLRCIRISLPKDRNLVSHKNALKEIVASFEKENKYQGHITIDIDPV
jgi:primosomal protein N' (replication factor Y)